MKIVLIKEKLRWFNGSLHYPSRRLPSANRASIFVPRSIKFTCLSDRRLIGQNLYFCCGKHQQKTPLPLQKSGSVARERKW